MEGTSENHLVQPPAQIRAKSWSGQVAQGFILSGFETSKKGGGTNSLGQPIPVFDYSHLKISFSFNTVGDTRTVIQIQGL